MASFGTMGILDFEDLVGIASTHSGRVLALVFDWYSEYANKPKFDKLKEIVPNFNPVVATQITFERADLLREIP